MGKISLEELAQLPNFYMPALSWKRDQIAFYWDKSGRVELYVMDLSTLKIRQISHGEVPRALRAGFIWSRNDQEILFAKDHSGDEQHDLWRIRVDSGQSEQITSDPHCQEFPVEFSPDNEWLSVLSNKKGQLNLFKVRSDGSQALQLTNYKNPVLSGGSWSPDGKWIFYSANETQEMNNFDIYLVQADGKNPRRLLQVKEGSCEIASDWSLDGKFLAITSDASGDHRAGLLEVDTGKGQWLGEEGENEIASSFSPSGKYLLAFSNRDAQVQPLLYEVKTGKKRLFSKLPPGIITWADFVSDDIFLLARTSPTHRQEMLRYDLKKDQIEVILPAENGTIDPGLFVDCEYLFYESFDGLKIPALLYKPRDVVLGRGKGMTKKFPAIMLIHGGPRWQWSRNFDSYAQFLADQGYVVFQPNIRGSTGYGVKFRDLNRFDWGGGDLEDVVWGAKFLQSLPFVDPNRLAIAGGSFGGYMTLMAAVKKPDLWKAAVAWVGISHLKTLYDSNMEHFKYSFRMQMGDPEKNAALWEERSPINYAGELKAKLLILHGVNDPRCPIEQARIFRDRLVELGYKEGKDFEYIEFADEGHGSMDIQHKIRTYKLLSDFVGRYL